MYTCCLCQSRTRLPVRFRAFGHLLVKRARCGSRSHLFVKEPSKRNLRNALLNVAPRCVPSLSCTCARQHQCVSCVCRALPHVDCAITHVRTRLRFLIQVELCDGENKDKTEARHSLSANQAAALDFSSVGKETQLIGMPGNEAFTY